MSDRVRLEPATAKSGAPTAVAVFPDGRRLSLHSGFDPVREAERLVASLPAAAPAQLLVIGCGLGYHVAAALARYPAARVYVLEPMWELADRAKGPQAAVPLDLARVEWLTGDEAALVARLHALEPELRGAALLVHPPSVELLRHLAPRVAALVETVLMQRRGEAKREGVVPDNLRRNLLLARHDPGLELVRERFAGGKPVLVTAGPSLDSARGWLRARRSELRLLATNTALPALLADGIEPDAVVAIDPFPAIRRHFYLPSRSAVLIYQLTVNPEVPELFAGRRAAVCPASYLADDPELAAAWSGRPTITGAGSVTVTALELLQSLAPAGDLFIVGADFGFPRGMVYARGTWFQEAAGRRLHRFLSMETANYNYIRREQRLTEAGGDGETVATHQNYFSFRQEFEVGLARAPKFNYLQVAGEGLVVRGARRVAPGQIA